MWSNHERDPTWFSLWTVEGLFLRLHRTLTAYFFRLSTITISFVGNTKGKTYLIDRDNEIFSVYILISAIDVVRCIAHMIGQCT